MALFSQVAFIKEMEGRVSVLRNTVPVKLDLGDEIFEYDFIEVGDNAKVKVSLYGINGVSSDLTLYSNTNGLIFYSSLKDVQDAKVYLFKGSLEVVIYEVVRGSSLSVNIDNYFFVTDSPSKFYVNGEYYNSYFVSVFEGILRHYNKDEYLVSGGTSVLIWDNNSFLSKTSDPIPKNVIQSFKEKSRKNFTSLSNRSANYIFSRYIEGGFRFDFLYENLAKDSRFNVIYSKWSLEDENHTLGDRVDMINDINYLKGRIGILFNNFIFLANMFFFIEDVVRNSADVSEKLIVHGSISNFFKDYKNNRESLMRKFFKTIHSFKMYLARTHGDVPSNLRVDEFYLLKPREF
ncbi:hypothetical protein [Borrelia sp. RT5S]|uniref:hypothetical protein n=1 Tax=Borrelia sp. RT5S TaxID=2898581 RepID=UPI001E2EFDB7|nr:hypothetical protein [Borrelia sp. RT5S]UGQ16008.1 hypothetical protein LSO06_01625 [Borrelia sp. RT5S]